MLNTSSSSFPQQREVAGTCFHCHRRQQFGRQRGQRPPSHHHQAAAPQGPSLVFALLMVLHTLNGKWLRAGCEDFEAECAQNSFCLATEVQETCINLVHNAGLMWVALGLVQQFEAFKRHRAVCSCKAASGC